MDRLTRCIVGCSVTREVSDDLIQQWIDSLPSAHWYYSDQLPAYQEVTYGDGLFFAMPDKSQTYSVEADNAELRHYLARLARRSRCFSRSSQALRAAVRLFIFCWNERQLYKQRFPGYPTDLIDFLCPCF